MPKICEVFGLDTAGQDMSMRQYTLKELEHYEPSRVYTGQMSKLNSYQVSEGDCFLNPTSLN